MSYYNCLRYLLIQNLYLGSAVIFVSILKKSTKKSFMSRWGCNFSPFSFLDPVKLVFSNCTDVVHCISTSIPIIVFEQKYLNVCLKSTNMFKIFEARMHNLFLTVLPVQVALNPFYICNLFHVYMLNFKPANIKTNKTIKQTKTPHTKS